MASRNFTDIQNTLVRRSVKLFAKGTGAGAANITLTLGVGMSATLAYGATGIYTLTLSDKYAYLLSVGAGVIDAGAATDVWVIKPTAETVSSTKTVVFQALKGGAATALTSSQQVWIELSLMDSSAKPLVG
jgi:hypothetical protein